jgi:hypothetical protein
MGRIGYSTFNQKFRAGTVEQIQARAQAGGRPLSGAQLDALRRADLDSNGVVGNSAAERRAAWFATDDLDRNGSRWSVDSRTGQGHDLARALAPGSETASARSGGRTVRAGDLARQAETRRRTAGGAAPRPAQQARRAQRASTGRPEVDNYNRAADNLNALAAAVRSGRIRPGSPGAQQINRILEQLSTVPIVSIDRDRDPALAHAYNRYTTAGGNLSQAAREHEIRR